MITANHAKEAVSRAYITAIAAAARQNLWLNDAEFDYGVDGSFKLVEARGNRYRETGFAIEFQVKCTAVWTIENGEVVYDLDVNAYNDLVERATLTRVHPYYLLLHCLPADETAWIALSADHLRVLHHTYYVKLTGPLSENAATVRVRLPVANLLTPASLTALLTGVRDGLIQP